MPSVPQVFVGIAVGLIGAIVYYFATNPRATHTYATSIDKNDSCYMMPEASKCPICQCEMTNENMQYLGCGHALHTECWHECKRRRMDKCPLCRETV